MKKRSLIRSLTLIFCTLFLSAAVFAAPMFAKKAQAKVKLNKTSLVMKEGDTYQLKVKGTKKKVTWKSTNKKVATVSKKGLVTAIKAGNATIKAKTGGRTYKCKVVVKTETGYSNYYRKKLFNKIISKKKRNNSTSYYYVNRKKPFSDDEEGVDTIKVDAEISVKKGGSKLHFTYSRSTITPDSGIQVTMILPLKGIDPAPITFYHNDGSYSMEEYDMEGMIDSSFGGNGTGTTWSTINITNEDEEGSLVSETLSPVPDGYIGSADGGLKEAFRYWNALAKDKCGIKMKNIGFPDYK